MAPPLGLTVWQFLMLNICLPYDQGIPSLAIYSREMKTNICTKTCKTTLIAALSIIGHNWKKCEYPLAGELINKIVTYPCNGMLLAIKRNELLTHMPPWKNLKSNTLNNRKP